MNIQILQWLLKNRDVLLKVVDIAKQFDKHSPYTKQWELVDQIARLVLPVLEAESVQPRLLAFEYQDDSEALAVGAECGALGVDYKLIIDVVIPIIIAILQALVGREE